MKIGTTLVILFLCAQLSLGYNILVPIPYTFKSVSSFFFSLCKLLADRGHQVTFLTPYAPSKQHKNINVYVLDKAMRPYDDSNYFEYRKNPDALGGRTAEVILKVAKLYHSDERIKDLWLKRHSFDLIVSDAYYQDMTYPFLIGFEGSFVQVCSAGLEHYCLYYLGNVISPAVLPGVFTMSPPNMDFWGRMQSLVSIYDIYHYVQDLTIKPIEAYIQELYPEVGSLASYSKRVDLTLINSNFALEIPIPLLPNQIEIGCLDCEIAKPLPKELKKFIDGSGDAGVVYFSLGSIANASHIPQEAMTAFLDAFRQIPQRVVFKYEGDTSEFPPNVLARKWLPQQDILGHSKTKVFISHCGVRSVHEAKFHGVPILAVPIAIDQPKNAIQVEKAGEAIILQWEELTPEIIIDALNKLINDTSYRIRLSAMSKVLQDQKESPTERAVWWLEYVVRHQRAPHLQYSGKQLNIFQYLLLDILMFWFAIICVVLFSLFACLKFMCRRKKAIKQKGHKSKYD